MRFWDDEKGLFCGPIEDIFLAIIFSLVSINLHKCIYKSLTLFQIIDKDYSLLISKVSRHDFPGWRNGPYLPWYRLLYLQLIALVSHVQHCILFPSTIMTKWRWKSSGFRWNSCKLLTNRSILSSVSTRFFHILFNLPRRVAFHKVMFYPHTQNSLSSVLWILHSIVKYWS